MFFLAKVNNEISIFRHKGFRLLALVTSMLCMNTSAAADEMIHNGQDITEEHKFTFGLNKGALFIDVPGSRGHGRSPFVRSRPPRCAELWVPCLWPR